VGATRPSRLDSSVDPCGPPQRPPILRAVSTPTKRGILTVRRLLVLLAALVLVQLSLSPGANATTWEVDNAYRGDSGFLRCDIKAVDPGADYVCFEENGDYFHVFDTRGDGLITGVQWKLADGTRAGICRNMLGHDLAPGDCNKNFPEGHKLSIRFGHCDHKVSPCSYASGYSWGAWVSGPA